MPSRPKVIIFFLASVFFTFLKLRNQGLWSIKLSSMEGIKAKMIKMRTYCVIMSLHDLIGAKMRPSKGLGD